MSKCPVPKNTQELKMIDTPYQASEERTVQEPEVGTQRRNAMRPLVSVVVIAYQGAAVILDTLESIRRQNYEPLELIISDDGSTDGTSDLVKRWLNEHSGRFCRVQLLTSKINTGICQNVARAIGAARGTWIKPIACDDILCEDAITKYLEQVNCDGTELAFSQITKFNADGEQLRALGNLVTDEQQIAITGRCETLRQLIRQENFLPAPGAFYSRRLFESVGGIDIRFKHLEDWPLWLRMLPVVQRVSWIQKPLVLYRMSEKSVSQKQRSAPISAFLYKDRQIFYQQLQLPLLSGFHLWDMYLKILRQRLTFEIFGNSWLAYKFLLSIQILSPLAWRGIFMRALETLSLARENAIPLARGGYYFGLSGLRRRIRVFGRIRMKIPRTRVNIGERVAIYEGVALIGKKGAADTISIGAFSTLESNSCINAHGGSVVLGDHVHVGVGCVLQGYGGLVVGKDTMLGPYVQVYTSNHRTSSPPVPRHLLGEKPRPVTIGQNCWIGANSILLAGTQIPDQSVLPACQVVRREDSSSGS
jgi:acetyltransferase-like isoleucine patch superfamily enzyme/glycosyltransferase involved in cell wall biosynthesis